MSNHEIEVNGWSDSNGDRHKFDEPRTWDEFKQSEDVDWNRLDGVLIHDWKPGDRDSGGWHWVYEARDWDDWENIFDDIDDAIDMYEAMAG